MALREIAGVKWGLVVQKGPWKETPIDRARAELTTGKPNAGHGYAYDTIKPAYDPHYIPAPPGPSRYAQRSVVGPNFNQVGATGILKAPMNELVAAIDNHIAAGLVTPTELIIKAQIDQIEENEAKSEIKEELFQNRFYEREDYIEEKDTDMNADATQFIQAWQYEDRTIDPEKPTLIVSNYIPPTENFYAEPLEIVHKIPVFKPPRIMNMMPSKPVKPRPDEYKIKLTKKRKGSESPKSKKRKINPKIVGEEIQGQIIEIPIKNVNVSSNEPLKSTTENPVKIPKVKVKKNKVGPNPRFKEELLKRKPSIQKAPEFTKFSRVDKGLKINTNVKKIQGPKITKSKVGKKMEKNIPEIRNKRKQK